MRHTFGEGLRVGAEVPGERDPQKQSNRPVGARHGWEHMKPLGQHRHGTGFTGLIRAQAA